MKKIPVFFAFFLLAVLSGCVQTQENNPASGPDAAKASCISLCQREKSIGTDLSGGPCIGNPIQETPDTVCDIAHNPRTAADDLQENQCSAFREGAAKHFVELDPNCAFIKYY